MFVKDICSQCNHGVNQHDNNGCNWESFWGEKKCECSCSTDEFYNPYCDDCGSCGEEGCCPPDMCKTVKCMYPDNNLKAYKSMSADYEKMADDLDAAYQTIATVKRLLQLNQIKESQVVLENY